MRNLSIFAFLLALITFPAAADAGNEMVLTLDKAVQLALENNKNYRVSIETVNQYKQRLRQNLGFLPSVTLQGTRNLDERLMEIEIPPMVPGAPPQKTTLDFTMKYEFTLQIVQPLFTGGKIWHNFKNARLDLDIAREKRRDAEKRIVLDVKKAFFNILVLQELLGVNKESLTLAERNLNNVSERFKLGMVSKYDLLRAELAVSSIKPDLLRIDKQLQLSLFNLKYMTGIPDNILLKITGDLDYKRFRLQEAELVQQALANASDVVQMKMQMKKANNLLKMAYGQFFPDISLVASYSYRADAFRFGDKAWENFYTINLAVNFPIFSGLKRAGHVGELKVAKKILGLNYQQLQEGLTLRVKELSMTIRQEFKNIELGLKNKETAEEGVRIARLNYGEGLISILELNSSIAEMTRARVQFFQAVYNYKIAAAELETLAGVRLKPGN